MLLKITKAGLRGRKRDTFLFITVLALAATFVTTTLMFHTSAEFTKQQVHENTFGTWHWAAFDLDDNQAESLAKDKAVAKIADTQILGSAPGFGFIGSFTPDLMPLAKFQMVAGQMPQNKDEIAVEAYQNAHLAKPLKVGDTVTVSLQVPLVDVDEDILHERTYELNHQRMEDLASKLQLPHIQDKHLLLLDTMGLTKAQVANLEREDLVHLMYWFFSPAYNTYNFTERDTVDQVNLALVRSFFFSELRNTGANLGKTTKEIDNIKTIREEGLLSKEVITLTLPLKVSGIINTYTSTWDLDSHQMPNAYITKGKAEELKTLFHNNKWIDTKDYVFKKVALVVPTSRGIKDFPSDLSTQVPSLHYNSSGQSITLNADKTLTLTILTLAGILTIAAVFQINLTQLRKRSRKMALMRAIGATRMQVFKMLAIETGYVLAIALPLGSVLGFLCVKGAIFTLKAMGKANLIFHFDIRWYIAGLIMTILAILIGMLIPLYRAVTIPLVGAMNMVKPRRGGKFRGTAGTMGATGLINPNPQVGQLPKPLSFSRLTLAHLKFEKHKTLLTATLYTLSLTCLIFSLTLGYLAFNSFRKDVVNVDKPSYQMRFNFGLSQREINEIKDTLSRVAPEAKFSVNKGGEETFLYHKGLLASPVISAFKESLNGNDIRDHFGTKKFLVDIPEGEEHTLAEALVVNPLQIDMETAKNLAQQLTPDQLAAFERGEGALLCLPRYQKNSPVALPAEQINQRNRMAFTMMQKHKIHLTFDPLPANGGQYQADYGISPGENLVLTTPTFAIVNDAYSNESRRKTMPVLAIVNDYGPRGFWPLRTTQEAPALLLSETAYCQLYPSSISTPRHLDKDKIVDATAYDPSSTGKTWLTLHTTPSDKTDHTQLLASLEKLAVQKNGILINYHLDNQSSYIKSFKIAAVVILLGSTIALFTLMMLYNMTLSKVSAERDRIGILQALGVYSKQFKIQYALVACGYAIVSIGLAHLLLATIILTISPFMAGGNTLIQYLTHTYSAYPRGIHLVVVLCFGLLSIMTYFMPISRIVSEEAVVNIRAL